MTIISILRRVLAPLIQIVIAIVREVIRSPVRLPRATPNLPLPELSPQTSVDMVEIQPPATPPANIEITTTQAESTGDSLEPSSTPANRSFESSINDRRKFASKKHDYGRRDWKKVTGICLHQTACVLGERPGRWDAIGCHVGVTRSGQVLWLHDFDRLIVHGNQWNTQTVGIEIDGTYEGVEGDIKTFWRPKDQPNLQPQKPTEEAMEAVRQLIRWICDRVEDHGGKVNALVAHRQASENRRNDPGSAIWQRVALPLHKELGLSDGGIGFKLSTGYAIPERWDPRCKGIKY